jgi:hypothetical protein
LDKVLRALGFTCRPSKNDPPGRLYKHPTGAVVGLPAYPDSDRVFEYYLITVRQELDHFGIADPTAFDARIQKAGKKRPSRARKR